MSKRALSTQPVPLSKCTPGTEAAPHSGTLSAGVLVPELHSAVRLLCPMTVQQISKGVLEPVSQHPCRVKSLLRHITLLPR